MSINAYQRVGKIAEDPRSSQARILARVTTELENALEDGRYSARLATAVHNNVRLWNALARDLQDPGNQLPDALKAQLLSLAIWVNKHSLAVPRDIEKVRALIDVNKQIGAGLSTPQPAAKPTQADSAASSSGGDAGGSQKSGRGQETLSGQGYAAAGRGDSARHIMVG